MRALQREPSPLGPSVSRDLSCTLQIRALTPIYKGGANPDGVDQGRPFRGPSVRGQLRFWWRATSAHTDTHALRRSEEELFGGVFGGRLIASPLRVGLTGLQSNAVAKPSGKDYALWVCRESSSKSFHDAGARASLRLDYPASRREEVERAVRAWLLLGGVGSRSRRGLGAVWDEGEALLQRPADADDLLRMVKVLRPSGGARPWPGLAGGRLAIGPRKDSATQAWQHALDAMQALRISPDQDFRAIPDAPPRPRELGQDFKAILTGQGPLSSPRAALGMPIPFRWQPEGAQAITRVMGPAGKNRYPSPVLLRPVPTRDNGFLPVMVALTGPSPEAIEVRGRGAPTLHGKLDPSGLRTFLDALTGLGWSVRDL